MIVLAESLVDPDGLLSLLRGSVPEFDRVSKVHERFQVFARFPGHHLSGLSQTGRLSMNRLELPGYRDLILGFIHFFSRRQHDRGSQHIYARDESLAIYEAEEQLGHTRTVVFGDFNMNPFDDGMIDPIGGFGAMMSRELASRHAEDPKKPSRRFYNPSWRTMARGWPEAPGTYYWGDVLQPHNVYWHSLDQMLVRPALFESFRDEDFAILTSIPSAGSETIDLVRSTGKHWKIQFSDHLSILFKLALRRSEETFR